MFGSAVGDWLYRAAPWAMVALVLFGIAAEVGQAVREHKAKRREGD